MEEEIDESSPQVHVHNLLKGEFSPKRARRRKILKRVLLGFSVFLALIIVAGAIVVLPNVGALRSLYTNASQGRDALFRARDAGAHLDFKDASVALSDAVISFEVAQESATRLGLLGKMPFFRKELTAVRELLNGGRATALALRETMDVGAEILSVFRPEIEATGGLPSFEGDSRKISELSAEERRTLLRKITEAPSRLGMARSALDDALASFARIPRTSFTAPILKAIEPHIAQLETFREVLSVDFSVISQVPFMLGYPEPQTYLFLLLNNTELRPGGGFIGTYGTVRLVDGSIESFVTDDIYALDGPAEDFLNEAPPEPLKRYLRADRWFMRDANWSPDYAVSSMNVERFYHLENGSAEDLDGVIGITPTVIERLLDVTGPITVDGTTFTSENVTDELEYRVEIGFVDDGIPVAQRKEVVGDLGDALVDRLLSLPLSQLRVLVALAETAIEEKHLLAYFADPALQVVADARGWSGRLPAAEGDELLVVDANLASLKSDPAIERTVRYSLTPDGDGFRARAEIEYRHRGTFNWKTTRYRTYTRFYVPLGSEFLSGEGAMVDDKLNDPARREGTFDVSEDLGRSVFGGFISIEPGETRTLAVEYRLPERISEMIRLGSYRLDARKQLGTLAHTLTLDLDFGKNVERATPPEQPGRWGDDRYTLETDLRTHRQFIVSF